MSGIKATIGNKEVDLEIYLMDCVQKAVDKAAERAVEYLAAYIDENWYDKYKPKKYERTRDFINSATKTETVVAGRGNNSVVCMIYFDTDKIIPRYYGPGRLNAHATTDGVSTAEYIPRMIERGAYFWGRGRTKGLGSIEATIEMLQRDYPKMVEIELFKMGLPLSVKMK